MTSLIKDNYIVIVAFCLPLLLVLGVSLSVYLPLMFMPDNYNFVYATCADSRGYYPHEQCQEYMSQRYTIVDGNLIISDAPMPDLGNTNLKTDNDSQYETRLFLYDAQDSSSREISVTETRSLLLSDRVSSPEGVMVQKQQRTPTNDFLFFGSRSTSGYYLAYGNAKKKLDLVNDNDTYYYRDNFYFVGWVLPNQD